MTPLLMTFADVPVTYDDFKHPSYVEERSLYRDQEIIKKFEKTIEKSKSILDLPQNWDEENAKPISRKIFNKTKKWLISCAEILSIESKILNNPDISPVPNGGIDIEWENTYRLLVHIEPNGESYYFDNGNRKEIQKGEFNEEKLLVILREYFSSNTNENFAYS